MCPYFYKSRQIKEKLSVKKRIFGQVHCKLQSTKSVQAGTLLPILKCIHLYFRTNFGGLNANHRIYYKNFIIHFLKFNLYAIGKEPFLRLIRSRKSNMSKRIGT